MRTGEERPSAAPVRDRILDEVCIRRQRTKNQPRQAPFEHSRSIEGIPGTMLASKERLVRKMKSDYSLREG